MSDQEDELEHLARRYARPAKWAPVPAELDQEIALDVELARVARRRRELSLPLVRRRLGEAFAPAEVARYEAAFLEVPRERFVLPEDIARSADDEPQVVDAGGRATVSAPHAYFLTFAELELGEGDRLLELGTGTGYGAALAAMIVGPRGHVTTLEIDPVLAERAARLLARLENVDAHFGDARSLGPRFLAGVNKIAFTYALASDPTELLAGARPGALVVAPVGPENRQDLVRWELSRASSSVSEPSVLRTVRGVVRYVAERR